VNLEREERLRPASTSEGESRIEKVPVSSIEKVSQVHA
jgi:hypothetical protein